MYAATTERCFRKRKSFADSELEFTTTTSPGTLATNFQFTLDRATYPHQLASNTNVMPANYSQQFNEYFCSKLIPSPDQISPSMSSSTTSISPLSIYDHHYHQHNAQRTAPKIRIVEEARLKVHQQQGTTAFASSTKSKPNISFSIESIIGMQ